MENKKDMATFLYQTGKKVFEFIRELVFALRALIKALINGSHFKAKEVLSVSCGKVLVVGNGPSLKWETLETARSNGFELLVMNAFAENEEAFFEYKPTYYCVIDTANYVIEALSDRMKKAYETLNKATWPITYICLKGQRPPIDNQNVRVVQLTDVDYEGGWNRLKYWLYSRNYASFRLQNVGSAALFFCINAKAKCVYLAGMECDLHRALYVDKDNTVYWRLQHHYGTDKLVLTGLDIGRGELYKYFGYLEMTFRSFAEAAKYGKHHDVAIYNLEPESFIDVFEKKSTLV